MAKKKILNPAQVGTLKQLLFHAIVYGALINYVATIFGLPFKWWGFMAYGVFLYLLKSEFISLWKDIWFRSVE